MQDNTARQDQTIESTRGIHLVYSRGRVLETASETQPALIPPSVWVGVGVVALVGTLGWVAHATVLALRVH